MPPILIQIISNKDKCARYDLSSVRWIFSGAAPLGSEVVERLCELFPKWRLGQGYGALPFPQPLRPCRAESNFRREPLMRPWRVFLLPETGAKNAGQIW